MLAGISRYGNGLFGGWGGPSPYGRSMFSGYGLYPANSPVGTIIHVIAIYVIIRIIWSWSGSSGKYPLYYWTRGIFLISFIGRWLIEFILPMATHEMSWVLYLYLYHAKWISWLSGGICGFTTIHALSAWVANVFCAICGSTIKGIACGSLDAAAFGMLMQGYCDILSVDWYARQMFQKTTMVGLGAIFVAGNAMFHASKGVSMISSVVLMVSGAIAVSSLGYWLQMVHSQAYGAVPPGAHSGRTMGGRSMFSRPPAVGSGRYRDPVLHRGTHGHMPPGMSMAPPPPDMGYRDRLHRADIPGSAGGFSRLTSSLGFRRPY